MRWVAADLGSISANIAFRVVLAQHRESRADGVCAMVRKMVTASFSLNFAVGSWLHVGDFFLTKPA